MPEEPTDPRGARPRGAPRRPRAARRRPRPAAATRAGGVATSWPSSAEALEEEQRRLATLQPGIWRPATVPRVGACAFASAPPVADQPAQRAWAAASRKDPGSRAVAVVVSGLVDEGYVPGLLALREGPLREQAVRALDDLPDVLLVDATGRDHPRRAGLALHLGAVLDVPTIGVTDRPLLAAGPTPAAHRGATTPLRLGDGVVGAWTRTRVGVRPVAVHAAWRTTPDVAVAIVLDAARRARTPQPLREARRAVRDARGRAQ